MLISLLPVRKLTWDQFGFFYVVMNSNGETGAEPDPRPELFSRLLINMGPGLYQQDQSGSVFSVQIRFSEG